MPSILHILLLLGCASALSRVPHAAHVPASQRAAAPEACAAARAPGAGDDDAEEAVAALLREHTEAAARREAEEAAIAEAVLHAAEPEAVIDDPVEPEPAPSRRYHHAEAAEAGRRHEPDNGEGAHVEHPLPHPKPHPEPHTRRADVQMGSEGGGGPKHDDAL